MKLKQDVQELIFNTAATANAVGASEFVIDVDGIRGWDAENKTIVILNESLDMELPFDSFAISNTKTFIKRVNMHLENDGTNVSAVVDDKNNCKSIHFKSKNLTIDFRCIKAQMVKAPKKLTNPDVICHFNIDEDAIAMIKKGSVAMESKTVLFKKKSDELDIIMEIVDITGSKFEYTLADECIEVLTDCDFTLKFSIALIQSALRASDTDSIKIGANRAMTIMNRSLSIIIPSLQQ